MIKIKAWEDSRELLIPISQITNTVQRGREVYDINQALLDTPIITLSEYPLVNGETIVVNGLTLTEGSQYDYTIALNILTFNVGILPKQGHVLINYIYE